MSHVDRWLRNVLGAGIRAPAGDPSDPKVVSSLLLRPSLLAPSLLSPHVSLSAADSVEIPGARTELADHGREHCVSQSTQQMWTALRHDGPSHLG